MEINACGITSLLLRYDFILKKYSKKFIFSTRTKIIRKYKKFYGINV